MRNDIHQYITGLLLEWPGGKVNRNLFDLCHGISFKCEIPSSNWEEYIFQSEVPLRDEDIYDIQPPYKYPIVARRSGARLLLLGPRRDIVEYIITNNLNIFISPPFRHVSIAVDGLAKSIVANPAIYVLSFVHARVPAFGASLRSVSFYGDDLGEASLFCDNIEYMNVFTCGLRRAVGGPELLRVSGDGMVSFHYSDPQKVFEVEKVLSYLRKEGHLLAEFWE